MAHLLRPADCFGKFPSEKDSRRSSIVFLTANPLRLSLRKRKLASLSAGLRQRLVRAVLPPSDSHAGNGPASGQDVRGVTPDLRNRRATESLRDGTAPEGGLHRRK